MHLTILTFLAWLFFLIGMAIIARIWIRNRNLKNKKLTTRPKPYEETHMQGIMLIEDEFKPGAHKVDFGIQIAGDGRVWICIDGKAFIRFSQKITQYIPLKCTCPTNGIELSCPIHGIEIKTGE